MGLTDEAELNDLGGNLDSDEENIGIEDAEGSKGIRWKVINLERREYGLWHVVRGREYRIYHYSQFRRGREFPLSMLPRY